MSEHKVTVLWARDGASILAFARGNAGLRGLLGEARDFAEAMHQKKRRHCVRQRHRTSVECIGLKI